MLSQVCALQKAYGKSKDDLETLVEGFAWVLAEYRIEQIAEALRIYIRGNSDIPAPSDLIKIIEPPGKKRSPYRTTLM